MIYKIKDFIDYYKKKILIFSFNEEIHHKLDITIKKLDISTEERVINPNNKQKLENFIIFKSRKKSIDFKYYVIRCQLRNTTSKIKRLEDDKYKVILELNNITNSIKFWNYIKEKYKNNLIFENNKLGATAPEASQYY